jgi:hypothetical protein
MGSTERFGFTAWAFSFALAFLVSTSALAQGVPIKSGAASDLATVDTNKNLRVTHGASTRATYTCIATGLTTTALYSLQLDAEASRGYKLARVCVGSTAATAAALQTVTIQRRTTASTGGTAATAEGTASPAVSQHVPGTGNWGGRCAVTPTLGTAGAVLDGWGITVPEIGAGTADPAGPDVVCKEYGDTGGDQMFTVASGTANGISVSVGSAGAGGLASGSISMTFIAE